MCSGLKYGWAIDLLLTYLSPYTLLFLVYILMRSIGIGRSVVRGLLKRGCAHVVAVDISQPLLDELNAEVRMPTLWLLLL